MAKTLKTALLVGVMSLAVGCASISYNPETGDVEYFRVGDQHIQGFEVRKTKDGLVVKLKGQQSNADALTEAIKVIGILTGK